MKGDLKKIALIFLLLTGMLQAQPGDLGQLELSVTERYEAQVKNAQKVSERPQYRDTTTEKMPVSYQITSRPISMHFSPEVLNPARIARIEVPELPRGMIKAGYGFYNTPFAEAYYQSGRSSDHSYGLSARHFSTQGGVRDIQYGDNGLSNSAIETYFNRFFRGYALRTEASIKLDKFSYYGLPLQSGMAEDSTLGDPDYNWYREYKLKGSLIETQKGRLGWLDRLSLGYTHFNDNYRSSENDLRLDSRWLVPADDRELVLDMNAAYFQNQYDSLYTGADSSNIFQQGTFQFQMRPHMTVVHKDIIFDFGINLFILSQDDDRDAGRVTDVYFFPEVAVSYQIVPQILRVKGGVSGHLKRNTYRELTNANPYIMPGQDHRPSRRLDLFAGLDGKISSSTSFNIQGGFRQLNDQALYFRNPFFAADSTPAGLGVEYGSFGVFYAEAEISTNLHDNFNVSAGALARNFEQQGSQAPWHMPNYTGHLSAEYTLRDKIKASTSLELVGDRPVRDAALFPEEETRLPGYADLQLELEYIYNSRIRAFIRSTNLLNQQYDLYLGYRNQSVNVMLGFAYSF